MMWDGWGPGGWGMGFGWLSMVLFWVLVALGAAAAVRWALQRPEGGRTDNRTDLTILRERYARGQIGREEYEQIKKDLET